MSQTADGLTNYCDDDLTFFALIYKNYDATAQCLGDLRKHYAASRVILRSDGDPNPRFPILAKRNQVDFREELRLFGIENGGAVIERMLVLFLEQPTRYLLKIDPDTVIHRRFQYLPVRSGLFGTLQGGQETPSVQGGCMGFTRDSAEQILQSEMLRDSRLRELRRVVADVRVGRRLADALEDVPARAGEAVRPLVVALVASDRYGAPLSAALERLAGEVRRDRRRRAEEAARRVPVKLLFPLIGCTLPAFALLTVAPLVAGTVRSLRL